MIQIIFSDMNKAFGNEAGLSSPYVKNRLINQNENPITATSQAAKLIVLL